LCFKRYKLRLLYRFYDFKPYITGSTGGSAGGKRYRIERTLGEGTYGKVKLAYDNYTREKVRISSCLQLLRIE